MATKRKNSKYATDRKFKRPRPVFDDPVQADFRRRIVAVVMEFHKVGPQTNMKETLEILLLGLAFYADQKGIDFKELVEWAVSHWHVTRWYGERTMKMCESEVEIGRVF